jgi:hypothetical protein
VAGVGDGADAVPARRQGPCVCPGAAAPSSGQSAAGSPQRAPGEERSHGARGGKLGAHDLDLLEVLVQRGLVGGACRRRAGAGQVRSSSGSSSRPARCPAALPAATAASPRTRCPPGPTTQPRAHTRAHAPPTLLLHGGPGGGRRAAVLCVDGGLRRLELLLDRVLGGGGVPGAGARGGRGGGRVSSRVLQAGRALQGEWPAGMGLAGTNPQAGGANAKPRSSGGSSGGSNGGSGSTHLGCVNSTNA